MRSWDGDPGCWGVGRTGAFFFPSEMAKGGEAEGTPPALLSERLHLRRKRGQSGGLTGKARLVGETDDSFEGRVLPRTAQIWSQLVSFPRLSFTPSPSSHFLLSVHLSFSPFLLVSLPPPLFIPLLSFLPITLTIVWALPQL